MANGLGVLFPLRREWAPGEAIRDWDRDRALTLALQQVDGVWRYAFKAEGHDYADFATCEHALAGLADLDARVAYVRERAVPHGLTLATPTIEGVRYYAFNLGDHRVSCDFATCGAALVWLWGLEAADLVARLSQDASGEL